MRKTVSSRGIAPIVRAVAAGVATLTLAASFVTPAIAATNDGNGNTAANTVTTLAAAPKAANVATVNGTGYATIADAVKAAKAGETVTLTADTNESVEITKQLNVTANKGVTFRGQLVFNAGADGSTIKGVHFVIDGSVKADWTDSLVVWGAKNVTVSGNTFDITKDAWTLKKQLNAVKLQYGADDASVAGNTFNIAANPRYYTDEATGKTDLWSWVGVNIVGSPVDGTKITGNTLHSLPGVKPAVAEKDYDGNKVVDQSDLYGSTMLVVGNGNKGTAGEYGITNLTVSGNTVLNETGRAPKESRTYGVSITNVKDTVVSGNKFAGYLAVSLSKWPGQSANGSITVDNNVIDSYGGFLFDDDTIASGNLKIGTGDKANTYGKNTEVPFAGNLIATVDGAVYTTVGAAIEAAGKTGATVTLVRNATEDVVVPAGATVKLDLNGRTLDGTVTSKGKLTITDSSAKNDGAVKKAVVAEDKGTISITGGIYTVKPDVAYVADGFGLVKNADGAYSVASVAFELAQDKATYDPAKGALTAEAAAALFAPRFTPSATEPAYTATVDEDSLAKLNDAIKAGKTGDFTLTLSVLRDGAATTAFGAKTVTVTLAKAGAGAGAVTPGTNGKPGATQVPGANGSSNGAATPNRLGKTGAAIGAVAALAIVLLAAAGVTTALRRRTR